MADFKGSLEAVGGVLDQVFKYLLPLSIAAFFLLVAPSRWLDVLGLQAFVSDYRGYIGLVAVLGGAAGSVRLGRELVHLVAIRTRQKNDASKLLRRRRDVEARLGELTPTEAAVLREFWLKGEKALMMPVDRPEIALMVKDDLLSIVNRTGRMSLSGMLFSVEVSPFVRPLLSARHLRIPEKPAEDDISEIVAQRPDFCIAVDHELNRESRLSRVFM